MGIADLPPFEAGYKSKVRFEPVPDKCDVFLTNPEYIASDAGKHPHTWIAFETVFPHKPFPHNGTCIYANIPNWTWCNHCGIVNQERHYCEASVFSGYHTGRCGRHAKIEREGAWYCKLHDPVNVAAKRAERHRIYQERQDALRAARKHADEKNEARNELVAVALELVEWLGVATDIRDNDEWAGQLYRRVEKAKEHLNA